MSKLLDRSLILTDVNAAIAAYDRPEVMSIAFDTETSGLDRHADSVMVVQMAAPGLPTAVLHVPGGPPPALINLLNRKVLLGHNLSAFDIPFLYKYNYDPLRPAGWRDTYLAEQLCVTTDRRGVSKSLAATAKRRLGVEIDKDVDHSGWTNVELSDSQLSYAASDVAYVHRIYEAQMKRLAELKLESAWETECNASRATVMMAVNGLPLVLEDAQSHYDQTAAELTAARDNLEALVERPLNPQSGKQVKEAFAGFGVTLTSTDHDTLQKVAEVKGQVGEVARAVLLCRKLQKASLYNPDWFDKYLSDDHRVRPSWRQLGTDTGRYSCSSPNAQQFPRTLRRLIGHPEGSDQVILSVDFSQIEILISALICREPSLVDAVLTGDVHTYVASLVFGAENVNKRRRQMAKAASFTLLFAGGVPGIIRSGAQGGEAIEVEEARVVRNSFYDAFPHVADYIQRTRNIVDARKASNTSVTVRVPGGPVRSLFGPSLSAQTCINTLVQGLAAVGLKKGLHRIIQAGLGKYLVAVIHDETVFSLPKAEVEEAQKVIEEAMVEGMFEAINVRPKVHATTGLRWG